MEWARGLPCRNGFAPGNADAPAGFGVRAASPEEIAVSIWLTQQQQVELSIAQSRSLPRDTFPSVPHLARKLRRYINAYSA